MKNIWRSFLQNHFSGLTSVRKRIGGPWYRVRENSHPATEEWQREPPEDNTWQTVLEIEDW